MTSPATALADPAMCAGSFAPASGAFIYQQVSGQCLKTFAGLTASSAASDQRKRAEASVPVRSVDAIALLDWAETSYPQFFPSHQPDQSFTPFIYRYYPENQNYLGVAADKIYVLGPIGGGTLLYVGTLSEFSCRVYPENCTARVEVQPATAKVTANGTRRFSATVTGAESTAVAWTVSGPGCTAAACGTIDSAGFYRAPTNVPAPAQVTVTSTLSSDPSKTGTATVEIKTTDNAKLKSEFAFLYQGFWNTLAGQCIGRFAADGLGNVTGGIADCTSPNYPGGLALNLPLSGTYTVFNDNRGEMAWFNGGVRFRFALTANGEKAFLQTFYNASVIHAGVFLKQDASAFTIAAIDGDYVFQLTGAQGDSGAASVGRLHANGNGLITSGSIDINNGTLARQYPGFTGSYTIGSNGRGTAQFTIPGRGTLNFALHVVDRDRLFLSSIDSPDPGVVTQSGMAVRQTGGPFSNSSLRATGVFHLTGRGSGVTPEAAIGLLRSDGVGGVSGLIDTNRAGAVTTNQPFNGSYAIAADGRGTIGSAANPLFVFYLVSPNHALLMSSQPLVGPVLAGAVEPQRPGPFSSASLLGQYASATTAPPTAYSVTVTATTFVDPTGLMTVPQDWTSPIGLTADVTGQGTYVMSANGRAVVNPAAGGSAVLYVISPTRFVEIMTSVPATPPEDKTLLFLVEQ